MFGGRKVFWCVVILLFSLVALAWAEAGDGKEGIDAFRQNKLLGRGVNLGDALDARKGSARGVKLKEEYFQLIKDAGFDSVRIPVRWSAHCLSDKPYTIEPAFFKRVDWAVRSCLSRGLRVVLNIHHYHGLCKQPARHKERYLAIWKQIAEHYKDYPDALLFEFLNEPSKKLKAELWNQFVKETLSVVRRSNPRRTVVVGPVNWNNINALDKLQLPRQDRNIIVSCHYYSPFRFTHQGASWVRGNADEWLGTKWSGTSKEKRDVIKDFDKALAWAKSNNRPIYIGEFGAYRKADMSSRALWTEFIARHAEERGFSWAYWEFCARFGVYDRSGNNWNYPLLKALIPPNSSIVNRVTNHELPTTNYELNPLDELEKELI